MHAGDSLFHAAQEAIGALASLARRETAFVADEAAHFSGKLPEAAGLLLIPSLVFVLYVGAFYQPLDNMKNTPVLLVNMDGGETAAQIEGSILGTNLYQFRRTSYEYAQASIQAGKEWAAIVIPGGFSERLERGEDAELVLLVDGQQSYIVTRVLMPTFSALTERINAKYREGASQAIGEGLSAASTQERLSSGQLGAASEASGRLAAGSAGASVYSAAAAGASYELGFSGKAVSSSLKTVGYSADSLRVGLITLGNGSTQITDGIATIKTGTAQAKTVHAALNAAINQSSTIAEGLPDSASKTQLMSALSAARNYSALEGSGLSAIDRGAGQLYAGSAALQDGIWAAANGAWRLEQAIFLIHGAQVKLSGGNGELALSLSQISEGEGKISAGQAKISRGLSLISIKENTIGKSLSDASEYAMQMPEIRLKTYESNKTNYGTFFATAFVVLGLFFGSASAYVFCALTRAKRAVHPSVVFCVAQAAILLAAYLAMGFPARGGAEALFFIMLAISLTFLMMTRAIAYLIGDIFTSEHLQIMSPILSLLAVFMISSGGAMWPQHTLNEPFSAFTPFIPFFYSAMAVRASALGGDVPVFDLAALAVFCLAFYMIRKLAAWLRARGCISAGKSAEKKRKKGN